MKTLLEQLRERRERIGTETPPVAASIEEETPEPAPIEVLYPSGRRGDQRSAAEVLRDQVPEGEGRREFNLAAGATPAIFSLTTAEQIERKRGRLREIEGLWLSGNSATRIAAEMRRVHGISESTTFRDLKEVQMALAKIEPATREALYARSEEMVTSVYRAADGGGMDGKKNLGMMLGSAKVLAQLDGLLKADVNVSIAPGEDYSKLTDDELRTYRELHVKVTKR